MATGLGVPPDAQGNGTTPEDVQRIIAALYEQTDGILSGCKVLTRSDFKYHVTAGAVLQTVGADLNVWVPVYEQFVTPDPAPASGSRTDTIFAHQNLPGSGGSSLAYVGVAPSAAFPSVPAGAVILDRRTVPAGATATTATTSIHDKRYARLTGAGLGDLSYAADTDTAARNNKGTTYTRGSQRFVVPTDRHVRLELTTTVSVSNSNGTTPTSGEIGLIYSLYIDGELKKTFERMANRWWESKQFTTVEQVSAGAHTAEWRVRGSDANPSGYWAVRQGGTLKYRGDTLYVADEGVAV